MAPFALSLVTMKHAPVGIAGDAPIKEPPMTKPAQPKPELDDAALAFAEQVFESTRKGDATRLADLLGRGLPANIRNHNGDSLLMLAAYHGHLDAARVLLAHGADPQLRNDKGQTPLAGAAFKGDLAMVKLLLEHDADVEGASPDGKTALMMAAMFNRTEIVEYLIAHGANPHAADGNGATPATAAAMMGATDTHALLSRITR
jgi:ankyrin repeat protein